MYSGDTGTLEETFAFTKLGLLLVECFVVERNQNLTIVRLSFNLFKPVLKLKDLQPK